MHGSRPNLYLDRAHHRPRIAGSTGARIADSCNAREATGEVGTHKYKIRGHLHRSEELFCSWGRVPKMGREHGTILLLVRGVSGCVLRNLVVESSQPASRGTTQVEETKDEPGPMSFRPDDAAHVGTTPGPEKKTAIGCSVA